MDVGDTDKTYGDACGRDLSTSRPLSARGISIATAKTSVNAGRHRRTYRQEPGHKGALAVRLRKRAIDGEKTLQGVAELAYRQSHSARVTDSSAASRCSAFSV